MKHKCLKCKHEWIGRLEEEPKMCPKCHNNWKNKKNELQNKKL